MKFQQKHHGLVIPASEQPRCPTCGGGMSLHIGYPNDKPARYWLCLDEDCEGGEISFEEWAASGRPSKETLEYFASSELPLSEQIEQRLLSAGWRKVGGHIWGGGFWGEKSEYPRWTGYKGQSCEYWLPPEATDAQSQ